MCVGCLTPPSFNWGFNQTVFTTWTLREREGASPIARKIVRVKKKEGEGGEEEGLMLLKVYFSFKHRKFWSKQKYSKNIQILLPAAHLERLFASLQWNFDAKVYEIDSFLYVYLFTQFWPNLRWGRFNNIEVDSINTLQVVVRVCFFYLASLQNTTVVTSQRFFPFAIPLFHSQIASALTYSLSTPL